MRDPIYAKSPRLLVKEQHSGVHIHGNSLSATSQHLHLRTWRHTTVYRVKRSGVRLVSFPFLVGYRITGLLRNPSPWFTWNEWTGSCLTLFLTFTLEGVSSGAAVFGWAARLWLVTASCNAFKTFTNKKYKAFSFDFLACFVLFAQ